MAAYTDTRHHTFLPPLDINKSQSAMEYLMTYGWAILIVAVVLGALYQLGVFSGSNFTPRAQPGSCKVIRPLGPGTTSYINLAGVCTGQLPQFVAQFNGQSSYIDTGNSGSLNLGNNDFTIAGWFKRSGTGTETGQLISKYDHNNQVSNYEIYWGDFGTTTFGARWTTAVNTWSTASSLVAAATGVWYQFAFVHSGSNFIWYVNGVQTHSQSIGGTVNSVTNNMIIGRRQGEGQYFNGQIADVQVYNTSLDAGAIQGLYAEGIGGAPQILQNLVGWWPLNGNANDYSGNNNNGANNGATFINTWTR